MTEQCQDWSRDRKAPHRRNRIHRAPSHRGSC
jgi:hypothetical protein